MVEPSRFEVVITAIVVKESRYLLERRALSEKRFPGQWSVPGGKLEPSDFLSLPKDTEHYWYNVLERTLEREVKEEVGIDIINVRYLMSLARVHEDGPPSLVISCIADYAGGEIRFQPEELADARWVTLDEAKSLDFIDGIHDELVMADRALKGQNTGNGNAGLDFARSRVQTGHSFSYPQGQTPLPGAREPGILEVKAPRIGPQL